MMVSPSGQKRINIRSKSISFWNLEAQGCFQELDRYCRTFSTVTEKSIKVLKGKGVLCLLGARTSPILKSLEKDLCNIRISFIPKKKAQQLFGLTGQRSTTPFVHVQ